MSSISASEIDVENGEKQVDDVEVETYASIHGIIDRIVAILRIAPVVGDVAAKENGDNPIPKARQIKA